MNNVSWAFTDGCCARNDNKTNSHVFPMKFSLRFHLLCSYGTSPTYHFASSWSHLLTWPLVQGPVQPRYSLALSHFSLASFPGASLMPRTGKPATLSTQAQVNQKCGEVHVGGVTIDKWRVGLVAKCFPFHLLVDGSGMQFISFLCRHKQQSPAGEANSIMSPRISFPSFLPSLASFFTPNALHSHSLGLHSQINYLHQGFCSRLCFKGTRAEITLFNVLFTRCLLKKLEYQKRR